MALFAARVDERERTIGQVCEEAVRHLAGALPGAEVTCFVRREDVLRQSAHSGSARVIYELPRELGGVTWRAVERGETQLVPDVASDPDYIAVDETILSEIAVPVRVGGRVVAVLNAESAERAFGEAEARLVEAEGERLAQALEVYVS